MIVRTTRYCNWCYQYHHICSDLYLHVLEDEKADFNSNPSNLRGNIFVIQIFTKIFLFFFQTNFAVNPIIYLIRLPNYWKTFLFACCIAEELGIDVEEHLKKTNPESYEH